MSKTDIDVSHLPLGPAMEQYFYDQVFDALASSCSTECAGTICWCEGSAGEIAERIEHIPQLLAISHAALVSYANCNSSPELAKDAIEKIDEWNWK